MTFPIAPIDAEHRALAVEAARALGPLEDPIAATWERLRAAPAPGGQRAPLDCLAGVRLLLTSLADGDFEAYFRRIDERGATLARTREQYEDLVLSFHTFEEASLPHLERRFPGRLVAVQTALDHVYHNVIAILARAYFREIERERERFMSFLAHDLRNPLNAIGLGAVALRAGRGAVLGERELAIIDRMVRNTREIDNLIGAVLSWGKLRAGQVAMARTEFDLVEAAREAARLYAPETPATLASEGRPLVDGEAHAPVLVFADRGLLLRAMGNYLSNAAKYARQAVALSVVREDGAVVLRVDDDGPGIREGEYERIFMEYYVSPGSKAGFGLGLASARMVAEMHGGAAWAESAPGGGARFCLRLPAA